MTLYCATGNQGKLREFQAAANDIDVQPLPGVADLPAAPETGATFEENAIQKALYYGAFAEGWLFADDSGLEVDALGGAPGIYSARYAGEGAGDEANNRLLLERMRGVENRSARFVCAIALARSGRLVRTFRATVEGTLLEAPRGSQGFGYDPLFYSPELACSLAEAPPRRKLAVSHRGKAFRALLAYLRSL